MKIYSQTDLNLYESYRLLRNKDPHKYSHKTL